MNQKRKLLLAVVLVFTLSAGEGILWRISRSNTAPIKVVSAVAYSVQRDVPYCSPDNAKQLLDIYTPGSLKENERRPLIVHIHGGSWTSGQKSSDDMLPYLVGLTKAGFVVASVNYRLAPDATFPAQIKDVKCAVRFLRAHSPRYHIDPQNIGAIGESAGGHLAALLGTSKGQASFETSEYVGIDDSVKAVTDLFGPADLTTYVANYKLLAGPIARFLGTSSTQTASPTQYVDPSSPPFLIIHGDSDIVVPFSQSQELYDKLHAKNVNAELITVTNAGHGLELVKGDSVQPMLLQIQEKVTSFFKTNLR